MLDRVEYQDPLTMHLTLTRECNLSCSYCQPNTHMPCGELSTHEWKRQVDRLTEAHGRLSMIVKGGEPMVRDDYFDILSHIKTNGHEVSLITNGTLITDADTARRLESCVDHMEICLDGISPETTDPLKGEGVFDRILAGIHHVRQTRIQLGLSFVILEDNKTILWEPLEEFMKENVSENTPVRIDNRLNFPVNLDRDPEDYFDFLRAGDKLACHGRLGKSTSGEAYEMDAGGCMHPYSPTGPGQRDQVKPL